MGVVLSFTTIIVLAFTLFATAKNWKTCNKERSITILVIFLIGGILSFLHLNADLLSVSTSTTPKSYTIYIVLCYVLAFIVASFMKKSDEVKQQEAAVQEIINVGALMGVSMYLVDGLNLPANTMCKLTIFNDHLLLQNASATFKLNMSQICGAYGKTNRELLEQEKSAVGRAIVGGAVLGPIGAIVGGLSGVGTKTKQILVHLMIITYKNSEGELKRL